MSDTKISRVEMGIELAGFWNSDSRYDEYYRDFVFVFGSVCTLADSKQIGWVAEISDAGYDKIELAYNELMRFGWPRELDDDLF